MTLAQCHTSYFKVNLQDRLSRKKTTSGSHTKLISQNN